VSTLKYEIYMHYATLSSGEFNYNCRNTMHASTRKNCMLSYIRPVHMGTAENNHKDICRMVHVMIPCLHST